MKPTYSENLLYHAGFQFQPRAGEKLGIDQIADVDVESLIRETDTEALSTFVDELTFCSIEVHEYSDRTLLKLFQLMQLCLEYLGDSQDTLAANLNGLSSKYATKKREIQRLSTALKENDLTIATLKDKLHRHQQQQAKPCVSSKAPAANEAAASRTGPTLYPVQERRSTAKDPAGLDEISSESSESASKDSTFRLHIVSSAQALYLQLDVEDSLSVHNLKNKIVARCLSDGSSNIDFEKNALFHRGQALTDPSLKDCGVENEAALVILPRPAEKATTRSIESKLEALASAATKSHNELVQSTRTLLSTQESSKAALVEAIQAQTTSLESALREEVQRRVNDAALGISLQQQRAPRQSDLQSPLSKLNIGELVETDCGEHDEDSDAQDPSIEEALPNEAEKSADDQGNLDKPLKVDKEVSQPLKVDTTAEVFDREVSPFIPPGKIQVLSEDSPQETSSKDATKESGATSESSTLTYSASSTQPALSSTRTPTPTKGYLDRKDVPPQEGAFRFSDASIDRLADDPSIGVEAAPKITPGRPATDSDMQSIEVSSDANGAGADESGVAVEKKRGRFGRVPIKRLPRWRNSKRSGKDKKGAF